MKDLALARVWWTEVDALQTALLRQLSAADGIRQVLALHREFEAQLQATEPFFRSARNQSQMEVQARLASLNQADGAVIQQLLRSVVDLQGRFEQAGVPSLVIGGLAVGAWGAPRLTRDAALKVLARREERSEILQLLYDFAPLHADPDDALRRHGIAFFQDLSGTRIDILLAETSFDETAIGRGRTVELLPGLRLRVCSAEDLIVYKMVSLRTQDRVDVEGIVR